MGVCSRAALAATMTVTALVGVGTAGGIQADQQQAESAAGAPPPDSAVPAFDGPPPPIPPAVITRDAQGRAAVRAVRIRQPLRLDGQLDEEIYGTIPAISGFIQQEPEEGQPATEQTEVWFLIGDEHIYISARCWDSQPERAVANEMRRDSLNLLQNDAISVTLDTFYDRRNSVSFTVNPLGGRFDTDLTDERVTNINWNAVWDARAVQSESGWTVEIAIPFKSLRYGGGREQIWSVNVRRIVRWKNEVSHLTRVPAFLGLRGNLLPSLAATMVGVEVPPAGLNLDLKPYAIAGRRTDLLSQPQLLDANKGDAGLDVKWGITKSLTADLTYNTDFAQVEDDEVQVNLTRFSLFFPEKREFFLEGQGIFSFGRPAVQRATIGRRRDVRPTMFFSRRIGLSEGRPVPIQTGGRLTGRAGRFTIGALNIGTDRDAATDTRPTNFSVLRLKRDLLQRSNVGVIYTRRAERDRGGAETVGADLLLSLSPSVNFTAYAAQTTAPAAPPRDHRSYLTHFDYNTDRYGFTAERLLAEEHFNPEVGFLRRRNFLRHFAAARFSPRPGWIQSVRKFSWAGSFEYTTAAATGQLETREAQLTFGTEFERGDRLDVGYARTHEFVPAAFAIAPGVTVPVGAYSYENAQASYVLGPQRRVAGRLTVERGSFYDGNKTSLSYARGRIEVTPQVSVEPNLSVNWVTVPRGDVTASVASVRTTFTLNPRLFVAALIQVDSTTHTLTSNVRFRWEYQPGSELFVVYSDGRDTLSARFPTLQNRALVVKMTSLIRF